MVYPTLEPTLTTRQPLQQLTASPSRTACALTGFVLERGSQTGKVVTHFGDGLPIPVLTVLSVCNVRPSQVHAQDFIAVLRFGWLRRQTNLEVIGTILPFDQSCRLGVRACQHSSLVVADGQCKSLTSINDSERHGPVCFSKGEDASVVGHKPPLKRFHRTILLLGSFASTCYPPTDSVEPNCSTSETECEPRNSNGIAVSPR